MVEDYAFSWPNKSLKATGTESLKTESVDKASAGKAYWKANLRLVTILLIIWALVSYGFGIVLRPVLDVIDIGGVGLGFWFAQQGSIYVFLVLIFVYAAKMNSLDRRFGVEEKDEDEEMACLED